MSPPHPDWPLIIGHRGASAVAPENTLGAFARAMKDGADGVEFDVRLSRDGVPVVIHDATLARTGLTNELVSELSWPDLQRIDVGAWLDRSHRDAGAEKLPSLNQVFELFNDPPALLYLEMKSDTPSDTRLVSEVVSTIQRSQVAERVILLSFDLTLVREVKNINPAIRTAALFEPKTTRPVALVRRQRLVEMARDCGANEIALHHTLAGPRLTEVARRSQLDVVVWTVDNPKWIQRARSWGIKALITNDPAKMVQHRNLSGGKPPFPT